MYLKSIEVQGFKSFANKLRLEFHNGITGIVGPNGSGKSNVADAVRWVLGEQRTKQLRGSSMQDVIFSGTELRKPLGYAFVSITLDNSDHALAIDFPEVTVSRRLYRSGESEYMINGASCRLKDINELFYDTGIGKEGYSIIGQGQIDQILYSKPEDRRNLFDEAAGIVKFKLRKDTAIKKLEAEKQNLVRLNDILSELEKQIGPLEKQSEVAKIYLRDRERLKKLDVNMFLIDSTRQRDELNATEENLSIASNDLQTAENTLTEARGEYDKITETLTAVDEAIAQAREEMTSSSVMREKLEGQVALLTEQIRSASGQEEHLKQRAETLKSEIAETEKEYETRVNDRAQVDKELADYEEKHGALVGAHEAVLKQMEALQETIDEGNSAILKTLDERAQIKSRMASLETMREQAQIRKAELTSRLLSVQSEGEKQEENLQVLRDAFEKITAEIDGLNKAQKEAEEDLSGIKGTLTGLDEALRKAQADYHAEKSKLEALENLAERYEGYGGSVKAVMEKKGEIKGIEGVVADIIKTSEKYETAIETALGGAIQNVVTDNEATAKRLIEFLKQQKAGRVTFLPLTEISRIREFEQKEALNESGVIGLANTLVETEAKYSDVADSLLGRILVVDTVDNAIAIERKYGHGLRIVTLQGELLTPGGAISGGAYKNASNLLGRRREIDALKKRVKELLQAEKDAESDIEKTKARRNELRFTIENARKALQEKFIEQNTARMNVVREEEKQKEAEGSVQALKRENEELTEQLEDIARDTEKAQAALTESERVEQEKHRETEEAQERLKVLQDEEQEKLAAVNDQAVEAEKIRAKRAFEQETIDRIEADLTAKRADLAEVETSLAENTTSLAQFREDIKQVSTTIEASEGASSDAKKQLDEKQAEKDALSEKQKTFFDRVGALTEQLSSLNREVSRLEALKTRHMDAIEARVAYMWDEYEITLSDAENMRDPELTDGSAMKKEIAQLKDGIKKLGDVNVNAIEDYKNLSERYEFMKGQHDDLVAAEEQLRGIIEELDRSMREQFTTQFERINQAFNGVFKEMFGGGKGTLELVEDEDVLDAGIRINAQPPGKALKNMMQLSGGEKALTAIALLFAIQSLKPSPFCLLDEIEAALDENNVVRFAQYLHKLKDTQFIVITHRRGTMESADRLYGITMQEKGVSTLVSVNLIEKEITN
ncbi:MAG: chromosome segregation protein SMC [Lachnospiraceae bacterium]|nr:chromosome segregation protein SMC [Lachnospiraceae bacterium]